MSNCFLVDVSVKGNQTSHPFLVDSGDIFNKLSYSDRVVFSSNDNILHDYVINEPQNVQTNYVSCFVRGIDVCGELNFSGQRLGIMYIVLYKTVVGNGINPYIRVPDINTAKKEWSFYSHPEMVLTYKTYKIGDRVSQISPVPVRQSTRIKLSYNKPFLFRPDDVIVIQYMFFTFTSTYLVSSFNVNATAKVKFDLV